LFDVKYGELISQRATRSHVHGHRTIYIISVIENGIPRKPISRVRPLVWRSLLLYSDQWVHKN